MIDLAAEGETRQRIGKLDEEIARSTAQSYGNDQVIAGKNRPNIIEQRRERFAAPTTTPTGEKVEEAAVEAAAPSRRRRPKEKSAPEGSTLHRVSGRRSDRIVHVELDRMRRHLEAMTSSIFRSI